MTNENTNMSRRTFMGVGAAALGASLCYPANAQGEAVPHAPNIVFIHVDQMSLLDSISAYGAEHVHTPAIDRIVKNGTSFMQSYASDPVCCPARASWWSGTYSSENGVVVNNTPCHDDTPDLSPLLQEAGYNTYFVGKWHVPGKNVRELFHVLHEGSWWGELTDPEVTRSGRAFLRNYNDSKPFFLTLGYLNPHDICITPTLDRERSEEHNGKAIPPYKTAGILSDEDTPPLPSAHGYDPREPTILKSMHRGNLQQPKFSDWSEDLWRMHRYNYHRFVEMVDREIGLFLDELERSPWRDNTVIVFSSDHGDGIARHWGIGKSTFYREVVDVPFVVATMGDLLPIQKDVRNSEHLVSGIDFARTICDFAEADSTPIPHGLSLRPLAEGQDTPDWRRYVYAENSVYMHMISDGRFKYVRGYEEEGKVSGLPPSFETHPVGVEQLFDMYEDPDEQKNLAYSKDYQDLLGDLRKAMDEEEAKRLPLRPIHHDMGLNFMKNRTADIRRREYPTSYSVK